MERFIILQEIYKENAIKFSLIAVPNAKCVNLVDTFKDNCDYILRNGYLIPKLENNKYYQDGTIFAIFEKNSDYYSPVGIYVPVIEHETIPLEYGLPRCYWVKSETAMSNLEKKINKRNK